MGPCAKTTVRCTLVTTDGEHIAGENWCANPQPACPREPGEDYTKCTTVCRQEGHAEAVAVRLAGPKAHGARAYLEGHTYACMACQHALFGAGVVAFGIGALAASPPLPAPQSAEGVRASESAQKYMLVPAEIINRFPEINPSNYDHDDACALNAWGVELVLAAQPTDGVDTSDGGQG